MDRVKIKAIIPLDEFQKIYASLQGNESCQESANPETLWCAYSRTTCHVREAREKMRGWWERTNGATTPGFVNYERVMQTASSFENDLYACFWTHEFEPCQRAYEFLVAELRRAFTGQPLDRKRRFFH